MLEYKYTDYNEYLKIQYETNFPRISWTINKQFLRLKDIEVIKKTFNGKKCLCLGCRHDIEVDDFIDNGFDAVGIDILPTKKQIQGDINQLEKHFLPKSFNFAYSSHSLEHTNRPLKFLQDIRRICSEGVYFVIPIRDEPDIEEPIFFNVMKSKNPNDFINDIKPIIGKTQLVHFLIRDDKSLPSGPEMSIALLW